MMMSLPGGGLNSVEMMSDLKPQSIAIQIDKPFKGRGLSALRYVPLRLAFFCII